MLIRIILILGILAPVLLPAQGNSFAFRTISINQGLSQSSVVDIAIDDAGFAWLATQDGLNRFDGKDFVQFQKSFADITTPTGNRLGKIIRVNAQELWLISNGGEWEKLNLYTQTFSRQQLSGPDQQPVKGITCLLPGDNETWIGTAEQGVFIDRKNNLPLVHLNTSTLPVALPSNMIQGLFKDSRQRYWVLTDNGVTEIAAGLQTAKNHLANNNSKFPSSAIEEDKDQGLWLGSFGRGLFRKEKNDTAFHPFTGFGGQISIPSNLVIETLLTDELNRIWIGTYGNGLYVIDPATTTVHHLQADKANPFSLGYNDVLVIRKDKRGGIWIGTDGGGLSYYDRRLNNFRTLSANNLPAPIAIEQIRSITTDSKGNIWAGTSNSGLTFISKDLAKSNSIRFDPIQARMVNNERIVSLYSDAQDDLWVGTQGNGLAILDGNTQQIKKLFSPQALGNDFFPDHTILCLQPAGDGMVWAGTRNAGLCLVSKEKGITKRYDNTGNGKLRLAENNVRALTPLNDSVLCIGFENKGVQFINTHTDQVLGLHSSVLQELLPGSTVIRGIHFREPYLWIGTYGKGLICLNMETGESMVLTEKTGLPNNTVYGIQPDLSGYLWLSTNKGICRLRPPQRLKDINRSSFTTFTAEDGLQSNEFNTGAHYRAPDGRLYFGGIRGLSIVDPAALAKTDDPVPVVVTEILVDNMPLQTDTLVTYKKNLELPYHQNSVSFSFAGLDIISAGRLNYYYQLVGYDKDWIDAARRNYVAYTNLQPGKYEFRVKASRQLPMAKQAFTSITIVITPPYWRTWWFIAACVLALAAVLYAIYRYRIRQLLKMQKIRNNIASDLHDDIGSTLTNISILSELSRKSLAQQGEASMFLDRISEEVQHSGQALDDIVWSINTNNDSLEQTIARMRRYAAEVFDAAGINYVLSFDDKFAQRKLNMEQRRDFLLLFKEAVNNIYKHAHAKNVQIETGIDRSKLFMQINDDGRGFDASQSSSRNGLKNMRQRVEKWGGSIHIHSGSNGTAIEFSFYIA